MVAFVIPQCLGIVAPCCGIMSTVVLSSIVDDVSRSQVLNFTQSL